MLVELVKKYLIILKIRLLQINAYIIIVLLLIVPSIIFILYLDLIIKVPVDIMLDVKLLFTFIFLNFPSHTLILYLL